MARHNNPTTYRENILRWPEVHKRVGICRSHAYELAARNQFPKPIKL